MTCNTFNKKLSKNSLLNKTPFYFMFFILLFCGCASSNEEEKLFFEENARPFFSKQDISSLIMYNYIDINPYKSKGLAWAPFILPNETWTSIRPSDFLIGYWNGENNPILPPEPGICRTLEDSEVENLPKGDLKLVHFVSDSAVSFHDEKKLFFLLNPVNHKPFAMVKMNSDGKASCFISLKSYLISTGYGQMRRELLIDKQETNIKIPFYESSYVKIDPKLINGIFKGDILRIGRSLSNHGLEKLTDNFNEGHFLIPSKINDDLFISGNFLTSNMGVQELLNSSLLIGQKPFELQLEPSLYTFAIIRKNKLVCLKSVDLKENEIFELSCADSDNEDDFIFEDEKNNYFFDATIFPSTIIESKEFQNWVFSNNNNLLLSSPNYFQDYVFRKEDENETNKNFNLVFYNPYNKLTSIFSNSNILSQITQINEINKNDFNKIYLGVTSNITSKYISSLRNNSQNLSFLGIPLGGTGEQSIANNAVPFSSFTKLMRIVPRSDFLKYSNIQASNGAIFYLFEPLTLPNNEGLLSSYIQQKFRLRIAVPPWNSTNIIEMYINGKIKRRWILDRGDISKPFSMSFEESISESNAFTVRWAAWGDDFLPDFLTGTKNTLPFAITRDYCIDNIGDGICHVEQEK